MQQFSLLPEPAASMGDFIRANQADAARSRRGHLDPREGTHSERASKEKAEARQGSPPSGGYQVRKQRGLHRPSKGKESAPPPARQAAGQWQPLNRVPCCPSFLVQMSEKGAFFGL